jgi:ATP-binding cassette subfamily B multidrug efflux pump
MIRLFRYLKPYATMVTAVLVLLFIGALTELYLPTLMSDIINTGVVKGDTAYIWKVGGFMLLIAAGGAITAIASTYFSARIAVGFGRDLRNRVFTRVESYSLHEFDKIGTATLITRTTNDITQIQTVLVMILRMMVSAPMMVIGGLIMAFAKDATLSLVLVVAIPLIAGSIALIASKGIPLFSVLQVKLDKLNLVLRENLTGIRVIRAFDRLDHEKQRFAAANSDLTETGIRVNQIMAFMMPVLMLVMNLATIAIVWFGGIRIDSGHMQIGDMMAFLQYAMQIMWSLVMLSMMFIMIPRAEASAVRLNEVLDTVSEINDAVQPKQVAGMRGHVEFRDVTFHYPGAEAPAISHISFTANPGQVTAIIGGTGSGKSTLISLIPRFYDVTSGSILVDGVDVSELTQADLRSRIGFVPQRAVLFSGSVAENLRFGNAAATDDDMRHAAQVAQATDFIDDMPGGFTAEIAQGGSNVSGGQKQRLSIARALIRRPEVYIFDDSFSALDFKTDARLRSALRPETAESTVLIVAQRISTVMDADQIIVVDDGAIAGIGTHRELLNTCDVYREIASSQLSEEELA